jgi:diadenosine tetraphosphate (Ap4A) HIT family hydrolase
VVLEGEMTVAFVELSRANAEHVLAILKLHINDVRDLDREMCSA